MFGKNLQRRERLLLGICIVLGALATLYGVIIEPLAENWKALNKRIERKALELGRNAKLLGMSKAIEAEYLNYSEFIASGRTEEGEFAAVLAKIEDIARKTSLRIANVKPSPARKRGAYKEISVVVTAEGGIEELAQFLYDIEASKELLRVKHFAITPKSSSSDSLKGTFIISKIIVG